MVERAMTGAREAQDVKACRAEGIEVLRDDRLGKLAGVEGIYLKTGRGAYVVVGKRVGWQRRRLLLSAAIKRHRAGVHCHVWLT